MNDRQTSKRRKLASLQMEADLNKSSLCQRGLVGRPHRDVPRSSAVEPTNVQPPASNETGRVAPTAQPLASNETGQVAPTDQLIPPQEGNVAPVAGAPMGPFYDGSYSGMRGAYPKGYEHGADYGGYTATRFNSSMVDDDEAASRAEYHYMQRQASRTPAYGDPYGCPCPSARSASLRTSFDGRERESQSSHALERIEGIMARMERHLVASTHAPAALTAPYPVPFYPGKFHSFHFHFELLKICLYFAVFMFREFTPLYVTEGPSRRWPARVV
jgi:hypothetical protein